MRGSHVHGVAVLADLGPQSRVIFSRRILTKNKMYLAVAWSRGLPSARDPRYLVIIVW